MIFTHHLCLIYFIFLFIHDLNDAFTPPKTDFDAYGLKMAMNEHFLVLAQNNEQPPTFFIQYAPYNNTKPSSQCSITYPRSTESFIYTVAIGKKQSKSQKHFFFAGELINDQNRPFIGIARYNNKNSASNIDTTTSDLCSTSVSFSLQYLHNYEHQEYYILGVDPNGIRAFGFSNKFIFIFDSRNTSNLNIWNGNLIWLDNSFIPHAVDIRENFGVIAGFIRSGENTTVNYSPMIYLINFDSLNNRPIVVDQYKPIATPGTWQDLLANADANVYSAKYDMSVSINNQGNILVGMQFINRVFLLSVNLKQPNKLTFVSRHTNGRSLGNGKGVAWLDNGIAAVLINTYSLSYEWSSSQVFFFDISQNGYTSATIPLSAFPNRNQLLPPSFNSIFLNIVSSASALALLDIEGNIIIFTPTQPGFYPSVQDIRSKPFITLPKICKPGTYKDRIGIHDCILCSTGTKNPGSSNKQCISCSTQSFCPLGSVADVSKSALETKFQVIPYPHSPESTIFDEILIHNMFTIGHGRCVLVSPLFWVLVVAGLAILIVIMMQILKQCIKGPKSAKIRKVLKVVFRHTDLLGEGELWVGGLVSFCIIVLICFAYTFSHAYYKQYPIENSLPSYFACDTTIRNAKFQTNVQSLAIPLTHEEEKMFDLLNHQEFTMKVDFINTLISCDAVSIQAQFGLIWLTIRWLDCNSSNSILTLSIPLPYQQISVKIFIEDTKTIGGIRIGLDGADRESEKYTLHKLQFYQSFSKTGYVLSQTLPVVLAMTKVVNETKPMVGEASEFSGIYIPTFTVDRNSLFVSNDQYVRSSLTLTTFTIVISETPYYVKNLQEPIARQSEIVFRNLLFTVVCLEIFGLVFLIYKIVVEPIYGLITRKSRNKNKNKNKNNTPKHRQEHTDL